MVPINSVRAIAISGGYDRRNAPSHLAARIAERRVQQRDARVPVQRGVDPLPARRIARALHEIVAVLQAVNAPPWGMGERILQAVKDHATGCDQQDDITLVCLGRLAN